MRNDCHIMWMLVSMSISNLLFAFFSHCCCCCSSANSSQRLSNAYIKYHQENSQLEIENLQWIPWVNIIFEHSSAQLKSKHDEKRFTQTHTHRESKKAGKSDGKKFIVLFIDVIAKVNDCDDNSFRIVQQLNTGKR